MKLKFIFTLFFFLISSVYALPQITEIRYSEGEFIELVHDPTLNISGKKVFDSSAPDSFNTLEEISHVGSNISLLFGSRFVEEFNLSSLNCNLYQTDRSQLSNGGLKDSGEKIHIEINETFNLSFIPENFFSFSENESLHFSLDTLQGSILNVSPCSISILKVEENNQSEVNESENQEDEQEQEINQSTICTESFSIEVEENIFDDKLTFKHLTEAKNFSISYWIEDFKGNLLKENRTTTNLNEKFFTPSLDESQAMQIVSELRTQQCFLKNTSLVFFKGEESLEKKTCSFEILPERDFFEEKIQFSFATDQEDFTIRYRIEDMKRNVVKEELETKNTNLKSFTPKEETTALYKIIAELNANECNLKRQKVLPFHGLEPEEEIIYIDTGVHIEEQKEGIQEFFLQKNILISSLYIREEKFEQGSCKILRNTATISEEVILSSGNSILSLEINESKLREKELLGEEELTFRCSYTKKERRTPFVFREHFNYTVKELETNYVELNEATLSQQRRSSQEESKTELKQEEYLSKGFEYKSYAPYGVIGVLTLLLSAFFFRVSI